DTNGEDEEISVGDTTTGREDEIDGSREEEVDGENGQEKNAADPEEKVEKNAATEEVQLEYHLPHSCEQEDAEIKRFSSPVQQDKLRYLIFTNLLSSHVPALENPLSLRGHLLRAHRGKRTILATMDLWTNMPTSAFSMVCRTSHQVRGG
ncbi:unnamed protein product, partial [Amoebophrya sp. A25]